MGGDHRAADRRVVVGRLWVKGVVAGVWQGWVGFWWGFGGVRVEAEGGGGAYGGEFRGWVLVFSMG
jgi:hypothetical protein